MSCSRVYQTTDFFFFFSKFIYLFIFSCVGSSLLHAGFLQLRRAGVTLRCGVQASHCHGFSCCGTQACGLSHCSSRALGRRLSSCGARAWLLRGMWDLPGPGLQPVSPELAGGLLTTAPPGKPQTIDFSIFILCLTILVNFLSSNSFLSGLFNIFPV